MGDRYPTTEDRHHHYQHRPKSTTDSVVVEQHHVILQRRAGSTSGNASQRQSVSLQLCVGIAIIRSWSTQPKHITLAEAGCFVVEVCTRENKGFLNCIEQSVCAMLHQPNADYYPSMQIRKVVKVEKLKSRTSTISTSNLAK